MGSKEESDSSLGVKFPSPDYVVDGFLDLAQVTDSDVVYDLGCNDGKLLVAAAERRQARCVGIERDVEAYEKAKAAVAKACVNGLVDIILGDALEIDLGKATVVYLYLSPSGLQLLEPKLRSDLSPDARVISHMFRIPNWDQYLVEVKGATSQLPGKMDVSAIARLYRYTVPPREGSFLVLREE